MKSVVFVGGGRITTAIIGGLRRAGHDQPLIVHDRHTSKMRKLEREFGIRAEASLAKAVAAAHLLVVAVRPASVTELLSVLSLQMSGNGGGNIRRKRQLIAISLAAGVSLASLRAQLGAPVRWARAMPSPACRMGRGLTAICFDPVMLHSAREQVRRLFRTIGRVVEIPEKQFDAFTVTYSVSHGYHALAALAGAARKLGLDRATALDAAAHALADGILAWREEQPPIKNLLREAATPGGVAAAVMNFLNAAGYERIIHDALRAGVEKARKVEREK